MLPSKLECLPALKPVFKMRSLIAFILIIFSSSVQAQNQIGLYQMNSVIPQSNLINPAFAPESKISIGLPIVSSVYLALGSPLSYNDVLVRGTDDSLRLDTNSILENLKNNNKVELDANIALLYFGLHTKIGYFSLSYNSRVDGSFTVPGQFIEVALTGSSDPQEKTSITLNELDARASWFNELGLGFRREITDKLTIGGRIKYLQGISNISLDGLNGTIETNIDSINIKMDQWSLHTAGLSYFEDSSEAPNLFSNSNKGWGLDLGIEYSINDKFKLAVSVLDLGTITWKEDTKSYLFNEVDYTFTGIDLLDVIKNENEDVIQNEIDSLSDLFDPEVVEGLSYNTPLTGKFYLSGVYTLKSIHQFGLVFAGEIFKNKLSPLVGLTYTIKVGKILNAGLNVSYRNQSFGNYGASLAAKFGPIQLYLLADSFESLIFKAADAKIVSFRFGINILAGKVKTDN